MPAIAFRPGLDGHPARQALHDAGVSQTDLARLLGFTSQAVNQMLRGNRRVRPEVRGAIVAITGQSARELFLDNGERTRGGGE